MLEPYRSTFNAQWTEAKYHTLLQVLEQRTRSRIHFRVSETPCFFPAHLLDHMIQAGIELTTQLLANSNYRAASDAAIPAAYRVPNETTHPHFMTVDFGLVRDADGTLQPRLVEMQAFPSVFGFQAVAGQAYAEVYDLGRMGPPLANFFHGLDDAGYWSLLRETIVAGHDPAHVVLAEVEPDTQKTAPDFRVHEDRLGIRTVDIAKLIKQGRRLFYRDGPNNTLIPIERIYNRAIVDEIVRKQIQLPFDYRDELDVEWAGHPNWYFRISKFSIPFLDHPTVPPAVFLDDFFSGSGRDRLPADRERWVLKPLYSFAGKGIQFAPADADLASIPVAQRRDYLLQERMAFEPVIATPRGPTQAEIRILYVWPDGKAMTPAISLVRMGRGLMMGVDHNREQTWIGGSAAFFPA